MIFLGVLLVASTALVGAVFGGFWGLAWFVGVTMYVGYRMWPGRDERDGSSIR